MGRPRPASRPVARQVFGFSLTNNGARDSWAITSTGGPHSWQYYLDDGPARPVPTTTTTPLVPMTPAATDGRARSTPPRPKLFWAVANDVSRRAALGTSTVMFRVDLRRTDRATSRRSRRPCRSRRPAASCPTPTATADAPPPSRRRPRRRRSAPPTQPTTCTGHSPDGEPRRLGDQHVVLPAQRVARTSPTRRHRARCRCRSWSRRHRRRCGTTRPTCPARRPGATWRPAARRWRRPPSGGTSSVPPPSSSEPASCRCGRGPASGLVDHGSDLHGHGRAAQQRRNRAVDLPTATYGSGAWGCAGFKPFGISSPFGSGSGTTFAANDFIVGDGHGGRGAGAPRLRHDRRCPSAGDPSGEERWLTCGCSRRRSDDRARRSSRRCGHRAHRRPRRDRARGDARHPAQSARGDDETPWPGGRRGGRRPALP